MAITLEELPGVLKALRDKAATAAPPTVTAIAPTTLTAGASGASYTVTGTGFGTTAPTVTAVVYTDSTDTTPAATAVTATAAAPNAAGTSFTFTIASNTATTGQSVVFTVAVGAKSVTTPAVAVVGNPIATSFSPANIAVNSVKVPFTIVGSNFLPGTTVSIPAADGSATVTVVTPNAITGTVTVLPGVALAAVTVTVTNTTGGSDVIQWFCTGN